MSYHNTSYSTYTQSNTNAQGQTAPTGFHYMPDGTLMADDAMPNGTASKLAGTKTIKILLIYITNKLI